MSKREIPLFVFDLTRDHNLGECDFVVCTDIENSFVAKIDYVTDVENTITDTMRIIRSNGDVKLRIEIKRITGRNPNNASIRTLMKKAEDLYCARTQKVMSPGDPSDADMVNFLDVLIKGNKHNIAQSGCDYNERNVVMTSIAMLEAIKDRIEGLCMD